MGDLGLPNWGQPVASLWSAPKLSAGEEAYFETLHSFKVPNLEWLMSKESYRARLDRLPEGESRISLFFFLYDLPSPYF